MSLILSRFIKKKPYLLYVKVGFQKELKNKVRVYKVKYPTCSKWSFILLIALVMCFSTVLM